MNEVRKAGSYTILHAIHIGERELVVGYDPENKHGNIYMTAFCERNDLFERFDHVLVGGDYAEIMELFGERLRAQAQTIRELMETEKAVDIRVYDKSGCSKEGIRLVSYEDDLNQKVVIIKPEVLLHEYRTATRQLYLCTGGFGASPHSRGTACYMTNLYSGKTSRFERMDVLAVMDKEALPQWAADGLKKYEKATIERGAAR